MGVAVAQRTIVVHIDDLTGKELGADAETIRFALDGANYEIDTNSKDAAKLRKVLAPFVAAGRQIGRMPGGPPMHVTTKPSTAAVRAWASARGIKVPPRGRIPTSVIEEFVAAGN